MSGRPERNSVQVAPDGAITWNDWEDCLHVWASPADLARAWWDQSIIRQSELRAYGAPMACVAELIDSHHPIAIDLLPALVEAAASPDELTFLGAVMAEDAMTESERRAYDAARQAKSWPSG